MRFHGKRVLVTGGGSGVGRAVALGFQKEGARVAIAGRRPEALEETASLATGDPGILTRATDVGDRHDAEALCAWAETELGGVDVLVSSAGVNTDKRLFSNIDPADYERLMRINAGGCFYCLRAVLPGMRERQSGVVVQISSTSGVRSSLLGGAAYNASKHAMNAFATAAALEVKDEGVRITSLCPGEINTPLLDQRAQPPGEAARQKMLQPEDVADTVLFIAALPPRAHIPEVVLKPTHQEFF